MQQTFPDAIRNSSIDSPYKELILEQINSENRTEVEQLSNYALIVAKVFPEYWSVDFAKSIDDTWYLIDMARGEDSFHWIECNYCSKEMREQYKQE